MKPIPIRQCYTGFYYGCRLLRVAIAAAFALLGGSAAFPILSFAETTAVDKLGIDPADLNGDGLLISGWLDGQTTQFSKLVRISSNAETVDVRLTSTSLTRTSPPPSSKAPAVQIEFSSVDILPKTLSLTAGTDPVAIRVVVSNVARPGVYEGTITFQGYKPGTSNKTSEKRLKLTLNVLASPNLAFPSPPQTFKVTRTNVPYLDTWLCSWLVPPTLQTPLRTRVTNISSGEARITKIHAFVSGTWTTDTLSPAPETPSQIILQPNIPSSFVFQKPENLFPDRYTGTLFVETFRGLESKPYTFNVDVRDGPTFVILALIAGLVLSRVALRVTGPLRQEQFRLLDRLSRLQKLTPELAHVALRNAFQGRLTLIGRDIARMRDPNQASGIAQQLEQLDQAIALALRLPDNRTPEQDKLLQEAINYLLKNNDSAALDNLQRISPSVPTIAGKKIGNALLSPIGLVADMDIRLDYMVWRPIFFALIVILLLLSGFQSFYIMGRADFGAGGLWDYLPIFMWALTSDIAQKTFQNISFPMGPRI